MPEILPEQLTGQGTRLNEKAPWETYDSEMTEKLSKGLEAEVAEYSQRRHEKSSSQNEEELCRQREYNEEIGKQYQWLHPSEYADEGPRIGRIIHSSVFINMLREKCNVRCWYREHPHPDKVTLLYQPKGTNEQSEPLVGAWVQLGFMPEFSMMRFDEHGVPVNERVRGWRTPLLQLIIKGVVSEELAKKVFGEAKGPAAERFNRTLYGFRNTFKEDGQ